MRTHVILSLVTGWLLVVTTALAEPACPASIDHEFTSLYSFTGTLKIPTKGSYPTSGTIEIGRREGALYLPFLTMRIGEKEVEEQIGADELSYEAGRRKIKARFEDVILPDPTVEEIGPTLKVKIETETVHDDDFTTMAGEGRVKGQKIPPLIKVGLVYQGELQTCTDLGPR